LSPGLRSAFDCLRNDVQLAVAACQQYKNELQQQEHKRSSRSGEAEIAHLSAIKLDSAGSGNNWAPDWLQTIAANAADIDLHAVDAGALLCIALCALFCAPSFTCQIVYKDSCFYQSCCPCG
jgi:hypothetical protein